LHASSKLLTARNTRFRRSFDTHSSKGTFWWLQDIFHHMIRNDKELIVVGDRVLVKVEEGEERTKVGLYLPTTALETQAVQGGTIVATGPGQPMPSFESASGEEPWKEPARELRYVPMQARRGDYALFFRKAAVEITFESERYLVEPQAAILALVRE
jgi:co-chaperonin GroES (HSP10)